MNQTESVLKRLCTVLILFLLATATVFAQERGAGFAPPEDVALIWAKRMGLAMAVMATVLIIYTLIFHRRRLMEHRAKWFLFIGVCVLPLPASFMSIGVGIEQSKDVTFCKSCHVMNPFFNDMTDPNSTTLAAVHYKNRYIQREHCWTCHSDYGIFGTVEAKINGLKEVYRYTFRTYRLPVRMGQPYDLSICLNCHAQSALFLKPRNDPEAHTGTLQAVIDNEISCLTCHGPVHPSPEDRSTE